MKLINCNNFTCIINFMGWISCISLISSITSRCVSLSLTSLTLATSSHSSSSGNVNNYINISNYKKYQVCQIQDPSFFITPGTSTSLTFTARHSIHRMINILPVIKFNNFLNFTNIITFQISIQPGLNHSANFMTVIIWSFIVLCLDPYLLYLLPYLKPLILSFQE